MALDSLSEKWDSITPRERGLVVLLGASAVVIVIYLIVSAITGGLGDIAAKNDKTREILNRLAEYRQTEPTAAQPSKRKVIVTEDAVNLEKFLGELGKNLEIELRDFKSSGRVARGDYQAVSGTQLPKADLKLNQLVSLLDRVKKDKDGRVAVTSLTVRQNPTEKELVRVAKLEFTAFHKTADDKAKDDSSK